MSKSSPAALNLLPRGTEFRFVNQLTDLDPGKSANAFTPIAAQKDFCADIFTASHFSTTFCWWKPSLSW